MYGRCHFSQGQRPSFCGMLAVSVEEAWRSSRPGHRPDWGRDDCWAVASDIMELLPAAAIQLTRSPWKGGAI
eukprot:12323483-Alexandrium_andersonii.AAC.1